jgi:cytochrome bd-type quinol oxidase subunit 1
MGLASLIVIVRRLYLRTGNPVYNRSARFWARVFGPLFRDGRGNVLADQNRS